MADISSINSIPDGSDLTEAQIKGIINRIQINLFNLLEGKWDLLPYAEFGEAGHRADPDKLAKELREQLKYWTQQLRELPASEISVLDDPYF